jgi:hypothetical protein
MKWKQQKRRKRRKKRRRRRRRRRRSQIETRLRPACRREHYHPLFAQ